MDKMIIYEDNSILVVHKPAKIATETSKIGQPDLVSKLKNYRKQKGEDTYIGVIHRLDQPVEGLLVFAKNKKAAATLTKQLNDGTLKKSYTALVDGDIPAGEKVRLDDTLLKDSRTNLSRVVQKGTKDAKDASLVYEGIKNKITKSGTASIINVEIFTGRHHQIRVQMSNAGYPLLGDDKYGNPHSKTLSDNLGIKTTALLADKITLINPETGERQNFQIKTDVKWKI